MYIPPLQYDFHSPLSTFMFVFLSPHPPKLARTINDSRVVVRSYWGCRILRHLASKEQRVTLKQLVEAWRVRKGAKAMPDHVMGDSRRPAGLSRSTCERLVLRLLGLGVLSDDFHFTAFSVVHYIVTGARAHALESGSLEVALEVPTKEAGGAGARAGGAGAAGSARGAGRAGKNDTGRGGGKIKGDPSDRGSGGGADGRARGGGQRACGGKNAAASEAIDDNADGVNGLHVSRLEGDCGSGGGGKKRPRAAGTTAAAVTAAAASSSSSRSVTSGASAVCRGGWAGAGRGTEGVDDDVVDLCDDSSGDDGDRDDGLSSQKEGGLSSKASSRNARRNRTGLGTGESPGVAGRAGRGASGGGVMAGGGDVVSGSSKLCCNNDDSDFEAPVVKIKGSKKRSRVVVETAENL